MSRGQQKKYNQNIKLCKEELNIARESGDSRNISKAAASLGLALFQAYKSPEGIKYFNEALQRANELKDLDLQVHCLGKKALAFQLVERYPDAFKIAEKILELGEKHEQDGLRFDAYASMGQILTESGEPVLALEQYQEAQKISESLDDPRRTMNINSAMGSYSLNVGAPDQAFGYFEKAMALAISLGNKEAEIGLLGNLGTILSWSEKHEDAVQAFEKVLAHVREDQKKSAEVQTLRHLAHSFTKLKDHEKVLSYSKEGLELVDWADTNSIIGFYEKIISTYYKLGSTKEAEEYTTQAIEFASSHGDDGKELDFLLSLGESFVFSKKLDEALEIYKKAVKKAVKVDRHKDAAYLTGRIGFTLAELGQLSDAILYHKSAKNLAQQNDLVDLEGEQLTMLAISYSELGKNEEARKYCEEAIKIYSDAKLEDEAKKARQLLESLNA